VLPSRVRVIYADRPDGGLRVYSPDVPGFVLSHSNRDLVRADVLPALRAIVGQMTRAAPMREIDLGV
jgi:hypothetical protein